MEKGANPPCQLCGSEQHGVMQEEIGAGRAQSNRFVCPLTKQEAHEAIPDAMSPPHLRFDVDLWKMAISIDCDPTRLP
jgi:hypothetical protein